MKLRQVQALEEVAKDLIEGRDFYDQIEFGVGEYFTDSIVSNIQSLKVYGGTHAQHFGFYRLLGRPFPFAVYYDLFDEKVIVVAVLDMRKDPAWIREKLNFRSEGV